MNLDTIHINKWILTDNLLSRGGRDTGVTEWNTWARWKRLMDKEYIFIRLEYID